MQIVYKKVNELIPYINNSRTHSEEQVNQIVASINEFGFTNPLLIDEKNNIIAGHGRLLASKKLKMEEVPCIVLKGLTEAQKKAYIIADNKMALNAGWDEELLKIELENLKELDFDLELTGFDVDELDDIFQTEEEQEIVEDDFDIEPPEEPKAKLGDIYQLGNHRLMCGDSTSEEDVEKLMNGNKADMVFTDPPYNIAYSGIKDKRRIENDKMNDEDFVDFLEKSIMKCDTAYVCCSWQYEHLFKKAMTNIGMAPKAMIIWNKVNPAQHLDKYFKQHEIIFYYGKFGGEKTIRGDIWECKRQKNTVHPTMKPIELIAMALGDWTGGTDVDSGATNRKLGSDMAQSVTGGGLHGKDLSKADVSVNIYAFLKAQETGKVVELCCAIGDDTIDGKPYKEIVEIARNYINDMGGFEKFAEWGLY